MPQKRRVTIIQAPTGCIAYVFTYMAKRVRQGSPLLHTPPEGCFRGETEMRPSLYTPRRGSFAPIGRMGVIDFDFNWVFWVNAG